MEIMVKPIPSKAYPMPALRPVFSVMDTSKVKDLLQIEVSYWIDNLSIINKSANGI